MPYALGLDLGTTFTAAAAVHADGRIEMVPLTPHRPSIPSVVALDPDDRWIVGEAAERRARSAPDRVAREFKRRVGDDAPALLGGTAVPTEHLLAVVIADVVGIATRTLGEPPSHVTVTHPAAWADHKRSLLASAVAATGLDPARVSLLPEPVAAAIHYAGTERVAAGTALAVYDLGGGTFDAAVLERGDAGFVLLGQPAGIERAGGLDIDQAVFDHVDDALGGQLQELDVTDPATAGALVALRAECTQAKEALSTDSDTSVTVALPGLHHSIRITRAELERRIEPMLRATVDSLTRAIESTGRAAGQIDRILLVGGSSRVPLAAQLLASRFGRPVVVDAHPKHAISLGAAADAAERAFGLPAVPPLDAAATGTATTPATPTSPAVVTGPPAVAAPPVGADGDDLPAPTPAGAAPPGNRRAVLAAVGAVVVIAAVAAAVALSGDERAGGDDGGSTTTTGVEATTTTPTTAPPADGEERFGFATRPIDGDVLTATGLRGGLTFEGVDPAFLERVQQIDPSADDAGVVAETYDATVTAILAARSSGHDGSAISDAVVNVTKVGTPCTTPAECLEVIAGGGEADYDGQSGRIELTDGGERSSGRVRFFEVGADGDLEDGFLVETDAPEGFADIGTPNRSDRRADDGVLRIGAVADAPASAAGPRISAAMQLAAEDVQAAGGIGIPVEIVPVMETTQVPEDDALVLGELQRLGVDAVVATALDGGVATTITDAGILVLQVTPTPPQALVAPDDVEVDPADPRDGSLRFGFGPSRFVYDYAVAAQMAADGCTAAEVIAGDDFLADSIDYREVSAERDLWELLLDDAGLDVEVVQLPEVLEGDPESVEEGLQVVLDAVEEGDCVVWAFDTDEIVELIAGMAAEGLGPDRTFQYLPQGFLGLALVEGIDEAAGG